MKIGIDGTTLAIPFYCGTKNYSQRLLESLAKIDRTNQYYIFAPRNVDIPNQKNFHLVKTPSVLPIFKRQFFLSYYVSKQKVDVFHYLNSYGDIFLSHPKVITTVHDTGLDKTYPYFSKYFFNRVICEVTRAAVIAKSKYLITGSSPIKKELIELTKSQKYKPRIEVLKYGINDAYFKQKHSTSTKPYFMCMGDFSLRKNIPNIMAAYAQLPDKTKEIYKLVVVSSSAVSTDNFEQIKLNIGISGRVRVLTNITNTKLMKLYSQATCFVFPSLYEGFGFPILEAMASGCPVITSNYGSMKEVAGNAAILIDPVNVKAIKNAMLKLIESKKEWNKYAKKGLKRARQFKWENNAKETLRLYKNLYLH